MNWTRSKMEVEVIGRIIDRALYSNYAKKSKAVMEMDLIQCHANGCPMNLNKLLFANCEVFNHDVPGILLNLDRATGKLKNGFMPCCARIFNV